MNYRQAVFPQNVYGRHPESWLDDLIVDVSDNTVRVQLIYETLKKENYFPDVKKKNKDASTSEGFRKDGNKYYSRKLYAEAMGSYHKAIAFAPNGSQELAFGYGNRSSVLFVLGLYEEALLDISRALEMGYKELLKPKLLRRRAACIYVLFQHPNNDNDHNLLLSNLNWRNPNIPCASAAVKVTYQSQFGRCVIATRNISPGTVLAIEDPYSAVLTEYKVVSACYGCCEPSITLIPCENCTVAMFCNEECRSRAWDQCHKYECNLLDALADCDLDDSQWLALRTVLKARYDHESWDDLMKTINKAESQTDHKLKGFVATDSSGSTVQIYDSKCYTPIHMLESNDINLSIEVLTDKTLGAAVMINQLKTSTTFFSDQFELCEENIDSIMYSVGGLILHQSMISTSNAQNIETKNLNKDMKMNPSKHSSRSHALGLYPFLSLINHSCDPNVEILSVFTKKIAVTLRPIKTGEQIFRSYGSVYWIDGYHLRQHELNKRYLFYCECEACCKSWPTFNNLEEGVVPNRDRFNEYCSIYLRLISKLDEESSFQLLQQLCRDIGLLNHHSPNRMLIRLKSLLVAAWDMFGNNTFRSLKLPYYAYQN